MVVSFFFFFGVLGGEDGGSGTPIYAGAGALRSYHLLIIVEGLERGIGTSGARWAAYGAHRELASPRREGPDGVLVGRPLSASWAARVSTGLLLEAWLAVGVT